MNRWHGRVPVTVRMAALTALSVLLVVFGVGTLIYNQFRATLRSEVDRSLLDIATIQVEAFRDLAREDSIRSLLEGLDAAGPVANDPELQAQILEQDGRVIASTSGLTGHGGTVQGGALVRVAAGAPVHRDAVVDGRVFRFVALSLGGNGRIFVAGIPIEHIKDAENAFLRVLGPGAAIGGILAAAAGWATTRWSLAPLREVAAQAEAIGALDLSQRLDVAPSADEIGRLGMTLNRMLTRLDDALLWQRRLTAEVGHELRTPLAIAQAELELLQISIHDEGLRAEVSGVLEEIERATGVIEDMLLLARADEGVRVDFPEPVALGALAREVAERFAALAAQRDVSLEAVGEASVEGDRHALQRALTNLVDNALRHSPAGGKVAIALEQQDGGVVLSVSDTGPGVPPDILGRIFDRYLRSGTRHGSAGLGLSIVAAVAAAHGGTVQARNRVEGGLEIEMELR
ncbi:MAG: ATP-binding protein [Actinomycetota bacterium]